MAKMENTRDGTITREESSTLGISTLTSKGPSNSYKEIGDKTLTSRLVSTKLPTKLCADLLTHLRKVEMCNKIHFQFGWKKFELGKILFFAFFFFQESARFRHINKEEEPPLRSLDHGLHGEGVRQLVAPYPYMIQSSDGVWYHGYRFDQVPSSFDVSRVTPKLLSSRFVRRRPTPQ